MHRTISVLATVTLAALVTIGVAVAAVNSSESQAPSCLTSVEATVLLEQKFPSDTPATPTTIRCEEEWAIGSTKGVDGVVLFQHTELADWVVYALGSHWSPEDDVDVCMEVPRSFLKDLAGCSG